MMERPTHPSRISQSLNFFVCALALLALIAATSRAFLTTAADWRFRSGDLRGIESAERILPSDARYHFARALALQQQDPASAEVDRELAQSLALNPRFSDAMLSWSVDKEFSGDKRGAEALLLDANRLDRQLRPSWALANFYYRQGDSARFWPQARECLRLIAVAGITTGRYDPASIFQLCWSMQANAPLILSDAIPTDREIEESYLSFLLKNGRVDAQVALAARMMPKSTKDDLWVFTPYINGLIAAGRIDTAVHEWNALVDRKILPYQPLNPAKGVSVTDGSFASGPSGAGFDWRTLYPDPIRFSFLEPERIYRFEFDGTEPPEMDLLSEIVPLLPNRSYRLVSRYRAGFDAGASGLNWVVEINSNSVPVKAVEVSGGDGKSFVAEFQTPAQTAAAVLLLHYSRKPGTTFIRGPFDLEQVSLKAI